MTVKDFIEKYKNASSPVSFMQKHIVKKYMGYADKVQMCEIILRNTSYKKEAQNGQDKTVFYINSPARYMFYCLNVISAYTDIEIDMRIGVEIFDMLDQEGLIDIILAAIPESEVVKIDTILKMLLDDMLENERSFYSYFDTKIEELSVLLSPLGNLADKMIEKEKSSKLFSKTK